MQHIVITEFMDRPAVENLSKNFFVDYLLDTVDQSLESLIHDAQALIVRNKTKVNEELLEMAPQLKVVGRLGVGLDNIDLDACSQRNIVVIPATGANDNSVAEYVITSAMMLLRNAYQVNQEVIQGNWPRDNCIGYEVTDKIIGFVGFGSIAQKTAKKAQDLGMSAIAYDPYIDVDSKVWSSVTQKENLYDLLSEADIISLHTPLTDVTKNLIDANAITRMKDSAILINTARGGIVNEKALIQALKNNELLGVALDTFEDEPINNNRGTLFSDVSNIILTPHIAGVTKESNTRVSNLIAKEVSVLLEQNSE